MMRKGAKWVGLVMVVVIVAAYVGSAWWGVSWSVTQNVTWTYSAERAVVILRGSASWQWGSTAGLMSGPAPPRFNLWRDEKSWTYFVWWPRADASTWPGYVAVPLWIPLVVVTALTFLLWRADRRPRVLQCKKCGYDRHGLAADAKCPECGTVLTKLSHEP